MAEQQSRQENQTSFQCCALKTDWDRYGSPEVVSVHYDLWELRIEIYVDGWKGPVYVVFDTCEGFRVLDESRLTQYEPLPGDAFVYKVQDNGWRSIEAGLRDVLHTEEEYFVVGMNDCVSVVSNFQPKVYSPGEPDNI